MEQMTGRRAQLLVYRFGSDATFEGQLVGALERLESGGTLRVLEALLVMREPETGELAAVNVRGGPPGGFVEPLLGYRLDPAKRRRATQRALDDELGATLRELGAALEPGAAVAAVLVEHLWARALEDAVSRTGGSEVANEFVGDTTLAELRDRLVASPRRRRT
jgi:hypothetical protein